MTTPAGWYPEPDGNQQRYWDGEKWTEHVAPLAGIDPSTTATPAATAPTEPVAAPIAPLQSDETTTTTTTVSRGGSTGKVLGGVAAAVLVVVAGFFAYTQLAGADGGADSPEAAVDDLMAAVSDEDLVGVAETVLPGERRTYLDPTIEGLGHLQRWGVLADDLDTSDVAGVDFQIDDLDLRTEQVADDVVNVYASGSMTAAVDGASLPYGDVIGTRMTEDPSELDEPAETSQFEDVMITTVNEDGRWYVSAMFTVGEHARAETGEPLPTGIDPIGASTPEAAVDGLIDAATEFDIAGVIARLNPDEAQALQRYAPLFVDDAQAELDEQLAEEPVTIDIELEKDITERDGIAIVTFTSFSLHAEADGEVVDMAFDGECTTVTIEGETEEVCADDSGGATFDFSDTPAGDLTAIFDDMEEVGLVVAQHDGEWYVSPIRSYSEVILSVMRAIDADEFNQIVDSLEDGSLEAWFEDEIETAFEGEFEGMLDDFEIDDEVCDPDDGVGCINPDIIDDDAAVDLDVLVDACEAGDMEACDDLYWNSPIGSAEELVALTCGGTVDEGVQAGGNCATGEPVIGGEGEEDPDTYGDDAELDVLWDGCAGGDMAACDDLFWSSSIGSDYESFAKTCGGRLNDETFGDCVTEVGPQAG
jgi:Protein of unknown function (DUF2510)